MSISPRVRPALVLALFGALAAPVHLVAQRADAYTWKVGFNAGAMLFQTNSQDTKTIVAGGAHLLIMARRGGLQFGIDEGFGSDEEADGGLILFNDLRRYQGVLLAFPVNGAVEPYFGAGGGILQVVGPRVNPDAGVTDPSQATLLLSQAQDASSSGFITALGGVQGRWGRVTAFAQYQISSAPVSGKLMHGAMHTIMGGIRIGLGSAREGIRGGGY